MPLKKLLFYSVTVWITQFATAQTRTLDELAGEAFTAITTNSPTPDSLYISLQEYHMLIERQPMSNSDKSNFKTEVNSFHGNQEREFYSGITSFRQIYTNEISRGADVRLDSVWSQPMEGTRNIFEIKFQISFQYEEDEEPVLTFLETMVGTVRRRYSFLSPIVESYE